MKKDQILKCRQKLWEFFSAFSISDIESSKGEKGVVERVSGDKSN